MANNTIENENIPPTAPRNEEPMDNTVVTFKTPFGSKSSWTPTQKQSNERPIPYNDPYINVVGDIITFPLFGVKAVGTGIRMAHGLYEGTKQLVKNTTKKVAEQGVRETAKQATQQAAKSAVKAVPALVGGTLGGAGVDMGTKALTGNTWGENASAILSHRYGINVPTLVGDITNPGYALGGWSSNRGINWARTTRLNKQNSSTIKRPISPEEKAGLPKHDRKTKSPYQQIGTAVEPKSKKEHITVDSPIFGDYIDHGGQQSVFNSANNPEQVLKIYTDRKFTSIPEIREFHKQWMKRNRLPIQERIKFKGYLQGKDRIYPVYSQQRINPIGDIPITKWQHKYLPIINDRMRSLGYFGDGTYYGKYTISDVNTWNVGYDKDGILKFFDVEVYKLGGRVIRRYFN